MKVIFQAIFLLSPAIALAAGSEHDGAHHSSGIPTVVIYQAINVAILIAGLIYFTKDSIVTFFKDRKAQYLEAAQKSALAREQAEREFIDIKNKINQLDSARTESLRKAQAHADDLKKQILEEAQVVTKRIKDDAQLTMKLEVERAQRDLREQLLKDSIEAARVVLTKDLGGADQQKLQKDFINHVGV